MHADHLDRPIKMTDGTESIVWDAVYKPFGEVYSINGAATNNLRFPGQYFLMESGLELRGHLTYCNQCIECRRWSPEGFL